MSQVAITPLPGVQGMSPGGSVGGGCVHKRAEAPVASQLCSCTRCGAPGLSACSRCCGPQQLTRRPRVRIQPAPYGSPSRSNVAIYLGGDRFESQLDTCYSELYIFVVFLTFSKFRDNALKYVTTTSTVLIHLSQSSFDAIKSVQLVRHR